MHHIGGIFMKQVNYLGFLSLLSLIAVLGWKSENSGLFGFLGFLYFIRYFRVIPDELFLLNVQRAATVAFMLGMISLVPSMFLCSAAWNTSSAIPAAFAMSFVVSAFSFTFSLVGMEWKEQRGAGE